MFKMFLNGWEQLFTGVPSSWSVSTLEELNADGTQPSLPISSVNACVCVCVCVREVICCWVLQCTLWSDTAGSAAYTAKQLSLCELWFWRHCRPAQCSARVCCSQSRNWILSGYTLRSVVSWRVWHLMVGYIVTYRASLRAVIFYWTET